MYKLVGSNSQLCFVTKRIIFGACTMMFLLVLFLFESISGNEVLDCAYNEWQCGDECIRDYKACNGTCPEWDCDDGWGLCSPMPGA